MNDLDSRLRDAMHSAVDDVATSPDAWSRNKQLVRQRAHRRPAYAIGGAVAAVGVVAAGVNVVHAWTPMGGHTPSAGTPGPTTGATVDPLTSTTAMALASKCTTAVTDQAGGIAHMPSLAGPAASYLPILVTKNDHPASGQQDSDVIAIRAPGNAQTVFCEFHPGDPQAVQVIFPGGATATSDWLTNPVEGGSGGGTGADGVSTFDAEGRAIGSVASIVVTDPTGGRHQALIANGVWWADGSYAGRPSSGGDGLVIDAYDAHGNLLYDSARDDGYQAQSGSCWRLPDGRVLNAAGQPTAATSTCKTGYPWPS